MFSIHRKLFLALKKIRIVKITPPQVPFPSRQVPHWGNLHPTPTPTLYHYLENRVWGGGDGAEKTIHGAANQAKIKHVLIVLIISTNYAIVFHYSNHVFSDHMAIHNIKNCVSQGNQYIRSIFTEVRACFRAT